MIGVSCLIHGVLGVGFGALCTQQGTIISKEKQRLNLSIHSAASSCQALLLLLGICLTASGLGDQCGEVTV